MNIEDFCEDCRITLKAWYERNQPIVDGRLTGGEPIPKECKTCYQRMLMEQITNDIRTDNGIMKDGNN